MKSNRAVGLQRLLRGTLLSQFLIPLVSLLLLVCAAVTLVSWQIASRTTQSATENRLRELLQLCAVAKFPLTQSVLDQIGSFSRCEIRGINEVPTTEKLFSFPEGGRTYDALAIKLQRGDSRIDEVSAGYLLALSDPAERFHLTAQAFWLPMATGILSTLVLGGVAIGIANRMVRRLENLESQVHRIAAGSYEIANVDPLAHDAIASLTRSVNSMSGQLEKAHEKIAEAERSRLIHSLAHGMAHQLRNSLAGAVLLLQTYLRRNPGIQSEELNFSLQQIQLAEESIRRLLTMSREAGDINEEPLSVSQIQERLECYTKPFAQHHRIECIYRSSPDDQDRTIEGGGSVVSGLLNLILNGMEAAGEQGRVECDYEHDPIHRIDRWRVRDNGPGPSPSLAEKMFDPFVTSKPEGIGLGLPTTALLAKKLGGELRWHRDPQWTEFEFEIRSQSQSQTDSSTARRDEANL